MFARKALSWTRVFTEMEKIVPPNLHVVSMKPEYTKTNDLMLRVVVATDSRDRAVELVRRMEKSNHFRQAQVVAEAVTANFQRSKLPGRATFSSTSPPSTFRARRTTTPARTDEDKPKDEERQPKEKPAKPASHSVTGASPQSDQPPACSPTQAQNGPPKSMPVRPH